MPGIVVGTYSQYLVLLQQQIYKVMTSKLKMANECYLNIQGAPWTLNMY